MELLQCDRSGANHACSHYNRAVNPPIEYTVLECQRHLEVFEKHQKDK